MKFLLPAAAGESPRRCKAIDVIRSGIFCKIKSLPKALMLLDQQCRNFHISAVKLISRLRNGKSDRLKRFLRILLLQRLSLIWYHKNRENHQCFFHAGTAGASCEGQLILLQIRTPRPQPKLSKGLRQVAFR